ncbi:hypothetical protein GGR21_001253 [Dysgonomonas hofstadii]|uniref:RagB/SusD family nutrient uptake outer membrane protein n=2 Tax=Dysgonomonas hofstadii TaxID=637886 RepID=A0A840CP97_9BACT|nr:hypothetical protein [Dysgonomonas hofstadii]
MTRYYRYIIIALFGVMFVNCEGFLDTESYTDKNTGNFPTTTDDATQMVSGVYSCFYPPQDGVTSTYWLNALLSSDDCFGGAPYTDRGYQAINHLLCTNLNQYQSYWKKSYKGISRANMALANLDKLENEALRNQLLGEVHILRAYFYFELVQLFENIPLMTTVPETIDEITNYPLQASPDEIYGIIAYDLKNAIELMPSNKWDATVTGTGHLTRWAAEGMLARVFLFYTGFYNKENLPLMGDDYTITGSISKDDVVKVLEDCIDNSGHDLVEDFRSLWSYTNRATRKDFYLAKDAPEWVEDGKNKEQVMHIPFKTMSKWFTYESVYNSYRLTLGTRSDFSAGYLVNMFPMGHGWGAGPVNTKLYEEWKATEPNDMRRDASIIDLTTFDAFQFGTGNMMEETGYWQLKQCPISAVQEKNSDGSIKSCYVTMETSGEYDYGAIGSSEWFWAHGVDLTLIRFADVLLMHSELTNTPDGINRVRSRAGLSTVAYSDQTLRNERRWELAFEGLRWGDVRRWGIAEETLANQIGVSIYNRKQATTMKAQGVGFVERYKLTRGFRPLPFDEIELSNGVLKQNPGWDNSTIYNGWVD